MRVVYLVLPLLLACNAAAQGQDAELSARFFQDKSLSLLQPRPEARRFGAYRFSPALPESGAGLSARYFRVEWTDEPQPTGKRDDGSASLTSEPKAAPIRSVTSPSFEWRPALMQSFRFLLIQHGYRLTFQKAARKQTFTGNFWKDYVRSVKNLKGWEDDNGFLANYVGHPLMGATTGFIFLQNHRAGRTLTFENTRPYWTSRLKSMAWSAAYDTYFEIGFPFSEAALGNVGHPKRNSKLAHVDFVVTPVVGTALLVGEDALDKYVIRRLEGKGCNKTWRAIVRGLFNPSRSMANMVRWRKPWYRDTRPTLDPCQASLPPSQHPGRSE